MPNRRRTNGEDLKKVGLAKADTKLRASEIRKQVLNDKETLSQIMREMGRRGGLKGAATLNSRLTAKQRSVAARKAANARWANTDTKKTA